MPADLKTLPSSELMECIQRDAAHLLQWKQIPAIRLLKTLHNPYSETYQLEIQGEDAQRRIYLKMPHASAHGSTLAQDRLAAEFKIMQALHQKKAADSSLYFASVAQPVGHYPEHLALATFEVGAQTLRQHYRSAARLVYRASSRKTLVAEVENTGIWLRQFQQQTLEGTGPFDDGRLMEYLDIRLDLLMKMHAPGFSSSFAEKLKNQIRNLSRTIDPRTHENTGRHNDFASHNILVDNGKIWVIDFSMYDAGSSAYDPAYFWLDMEMLKADPSYCKRFLCHLQEKFLAHYGKISPDSTAFQLVRCQYSINRILTLHGTSMLPTPHTMYRRKVVASCLEWLQDFVRQTSLDSHQSTNQQFTAT